jgi:hypothetical protein
MSPVKYELGFYISDDGTLHSHRRENLKSYTLSLELDITNALNFPIRRCFVWDMKFQVRL